MAVAGSRADKPHFSLGFTETSRTRQGGDQLYELQSSTDEINQNVSLVGEWLTEEFAFVVRQRENHAAGEMSGSREVMFDIWAGCDEGQDTDIGLDYTDWSIQLIEVI